MTITMNNYNDNYNSIQDLQEFIDDSFIILILFIYNIPLKSRLYQNK
jgi:hypothetical protein